METNGVPKKITKADLQRAIDLLKKNGAPPPYYVLPVENFALLEELLRDGTITEEDLVRG